MNPLLKTDFYKTGHWQQYPKGTEYVYSNFTPRSMKHFNGVNKNQIVWFGLQAVISEMTTDWALNFFDKPKHEVIDEYVSVLKDSLCVSTVETARIEQLHDLGYLPIRIKALPEGFWVNAGVPVFTITNTLPEFYWIVNFLETSLSANLWKLSTTATIAANYRLILDEWADRTGDPAAVQFQGHDFSYRGMSGSADAAMAGMGHLLSFMGTDTIPAIINAKKYYLAGGPVGVSVPATEHAVMCANGKETEVETFRRLITEIYPTGIISIVSDTWDLWKVLTEYVVELKEDILMRQPNDMGLAKVVFRPDSGDPVDIICGNAQIHKPDVSWVKDLDCLKLYAKDGIRSFVADNTDHGECGDDECSRIYEFDDKLYEINVSIEWNRYDKQYYYIDGAHVKSCEEITLTPQQKGAVECLWDVFGGTINEKGYKVLDPMVGLIYGDSITLDRAEEICKRLETKGFASTNVVFGIGSYTYQYNTRDTFGFAMKATSVVVNGERRDIFKDPKTDSGTKKSAKGLLFVASPGTGFVLSDSVSEETESSKMNWLETVYENGEFKLFRSFDEIKANVEHSC